VFDTRSRLWVFSLNWSFRSHYGPGIYSVDNRNAYQGASMGEGVKATGAWGWRPFHCLKIPEASVFVASYQHISDINWRNVNSSLCVKHNFSVVIHIMNLNTVVSALKNLVTSHDVPCNCFVISERKGRIYFVAASKASSSSSPFYSVNDCGYSWWITITFSNGNRRCDRINYIRERFMKADVDYSVKSDVQDDYRRIRSCDC
jgi:hypothetical protein